MEGDDGMRLIDADALLAFMKKGWVAFPEGDRRHTCDMTDVMNAPTIDAVPVVRCKNCKFNYANQIPSEDVCQLCVELPISKDFYCAYGERKDDETPDGRL